MFQDTAGAPGISINFVLATNNGAANQIVGAIALTAGEARTIQPAGTAGTLTLNGVAGTLLSNSSTFGLTLSNGALTMPVALANSGDISITGTGAITISSNITETAGGAKGITKMGTGTGVLTLSGSNGYTGTTTVTGGTLLLGADHTLSTSASPGSTRGVTLSGGTLDAAGRSQGTAGGARLGTLTLTANSTLQFTAGDSVQDLFFDDYDRTGGLLSISNWSGVTGGSGTGGALFFSTSASFTASELAQISFAGFFQGAQLIAFNANFNELVPIPEPSALLVAVGMLGLIGRRERRRDAQRRRTSRGRCA